MEPIGRTAGGYEIQKTTNFCQHSEGLKFGKANVLVLYWNIIHYTGENKITLDQSGWRTSGGEKEFFTSGGEADPMQQASI